MAAHMLDHFVFTARRLSERTKSIAFALVAFTIFANFWWFRGVAWGIDGPINDHWGLGWRQVRKLFSLSFSGIDVDLMFPFDSRGTFTSRVESVNVRRRPDRLRAGQRRCTHIQNKKSFLSNVLWIRPQSGSPRFTVPCQSLFRITFLYFNKDCSPPPPSERLMSFITMLAVW
jgi:hypothetical protein